MKNYPPVLLSALYVCTHVLERSDSERRPATTVHNIEGTVGNDTLCTSTELVFGTLSRYWKTVIAGSAS